MNFNEILWLAGVLSKQIYTSLGAMTSLYTKWTLKHKNLYHPNLNYDIILEYRQNNGFAFNVLKFGIIL